MTRALTTILTVGSLLSFTLPSLAAPTVETLLKKSQQEAAKKNYQKATTLLRQAQNLAPQNTDIILARARLYNWQGQQQKALHLLNTLSQKEQTFPDVFALRGYIAYNQSLFKKAINYFELALKKAPHDTETQAALTRAQKAIKAPKPQQWQLDIGQEISEFTRQDRHNWGQTNVRLSYFPFRKDWSLFSEVQRYERSSNKDIMLHLGGAYKFSKKIGAYTWTAFTPEPDYRPQWILATGGEALLIKSWINLSALLDTKFELYKRSNSFTFKPGLRLSPLDEWSISSHFISVTPKDSHPLYGWDVRFDGKAIDTINFFAGYAHAPEYDEGLTVTTNTIFGGIKFNVNRNLGFNLSYARDDRENSYIRHIYYVGTSYKF